MTSLIFFLLALAILVTIHEYGHFWVARKCGVKVLKFSVGFGKAIWRKVGGDGTEYVIAAIPLGGYVKMLDEREGEVAVEDLDLAFNRQPLRSRVAIVAAGPMANLLFAVLCYWLIFVIGIPGIRPVIGEVIAESPAAQANIIKGDEIRAINDRETPTWRSVQRMLLQLSTTGGEADFLLNDGGANRIRQIYIPELKPDPMVAPTILNDLGLKPIQISIAPIIGDIITDGAGQHAGLKSGDKILSIDGDAITDWSQMVSIVQSSPEKTLQFLVQRDGQEYALKVSPEAVSVNGETIGRVGAGVDASQIEIPAYLQTEQHYGPVEAFTRAIEETWDFSSLTIKTLAGIITGSFSSKNLGGPISIAQFAGASADRGIVSFIGFLAIISISLGILNLLPIPILDGGHLAFYLVEWIRGKPLSDEVQMQGQKIGLILLLMLMFLAFFNDLTRLFGQ